MVSRQSYFRSYGDILYIFVFHFIFINMPVFLFDKIIFGPVRSRRLGISLGINLLPLDSKLCNFNCIYCECGWTDSKRETKAIFHTRERIAEELEKKLDEMSNSYDDLDVITYAGNGEPTMHPDFEMIVEDTIQIRDKYFPHVRIAVLSNATLIDREPVFRALRRIDENILKLDSAIPETIQLLNDPRGVYHIEEIIKNMKKFGGNLDIQTMFVRGRYKGQLVDNTTEEEIVAWIEALHEIKPRQVMIYSIARDTPAPDLVKVNLYELEKIRQRLEKEGFQVQVSS
jgi:wyosine [tRNA(Phe)-imidazoG37] synthetase (radical SAM superfamily)